MRNSNNQTKKVIITMIFIVFSGLTVAWFYYRDINRSEDPRVVDAKLKLQQYQQITEAENYDHALAILDTIQAIYEAVQHYKNSYEVGVLYNNRSAIFLTLALHHSSDSVEKHKKFEFAGKNAEQSILVYTNWLTEYGTLSVAEIKTQLQKNFIDGIQAGKRRIEKIIDKRVKEIQEAQYATQRRLSVSYTNLGIVKRHNNEVEAAAEYYKKALELWDRNLSAKNNLNIILDKPLEKQNFIERMFPPDKKE